MLASCKNFLNAGETKKQIEDSIAYANANDITLQIEHDGQGLITPNGAVTKKIGYDFEIVFKPDTENYSINPEKLLKAVDYYDHEIIYDTDCVLFSNVEQSDDDILAGLYRIKVRISKDIKNLLIIPDCARIPQVEGFYPPYDNAGYPQDTSIQITFTSPVNLSDFADENGYLKNIAIYENDTNLLESSTDKTPYYANPYLSEDGTKLTIPVVSGNYLIPENSTTRYRNIKVELDLQNITDAAGTPFKKAEYKYNYRVNTDKDNTPPVLKKLYIARTQEDALNGTNLISFGNSYSDFSNNTEHCVAHIKEHHVKDFWIYFEAEDSESGVECLEISEKQLYTKSAEEVEGDIFSHAIVNNDITNKNFSGLYKFVFESDTVGLFDIEFSLKDRANNSIKNEDKKKVLLIKDTEMENVSVIVSSNGKSEANSTGTVQISFIVKLDEGNNSWFWKMLDEPTERWCHKEFEPRQRGFWTDDKLELLSIEYGNDLQNLTSYPLPSTVSTQIECTANVIPTKKAYVKVTVKDSIGNLYEKTQTIDPVHNITSYKKTDANKLGLYGVGYGVSCYGYFQLKNKDGDIIKESAKTGSIPSTNYFEFYILIPGSWELLPEIEKITWNDGTTTTITQLFSSYSTDYYLSVTPITDYYVGQTVTIDLSKTSSQDLSVELPLFDVEKLPVVKSSGKTYFKISNFRKQNGEQFVGNANCNYFVKFNNTDEEARAYYQSILSFTEPIVIEVNYEICEYSFTVGASNNEGKSVTAPSQSIGITVLDDSISPVVGINPGADDDFCKWWELSSNRLLVKDFIHENGIGLPEEDYEDEYGVYKRVPIKYYFNYSKNTNTIDWNADYIKTAYYYTQKLSSKTTEDPHVLDPFIEFPRDGSKANVFHALVKDKNGNSNEYRASSKPENSHFFLICEESDGTLQRGDIYALGSGFYEWYSVEYSDKNKWNYTSQMTTFVGEGDNSIAKYTYLSSHDPAVTRYDVTYTDKEKESFIRLLVREGGGYTSTVNPARKPLYYCPAYYDSTSNITCNLKGAYETNMGLAILSDAGSPVLAHTYYCSTDLGTDPEEWLYFGMETGVRSEKGGFTYTSDNFKHVPNGMYYTTVIHYADGTICMTDVKKMQK